MCKVKLEGEGIIKIRVWGESRGGSEVISRDYLFRGSYLMYFIKLKDDKL
jgi:hypothetical protein